MYLKNRCSLESGIVLTFAAILFGLAVPTAQASYIVTFQQTGGDVVATGTGSIDLTGLTFSGTSGISAFVHAADAAELTGSGSINVYTGFSGPASFGPGGFIVATSAAGDPVAVDEADVELAVPFAYVSGNPLSSSATFSSATFASLGLTPGTYTYTFGSGAHADTYEVQIASPVPEPSTFVLLGGSALVLWLLRRRACCM